jgi:hypothetical protein
MSITEADVGVNICAGLRGRAWRHSSGAPKPFPLLPLCAIGRFGPVCRSYVGPPELPLFRRERFERFVDAQIRDRKGDGQGRTFRHAPDRRTGTLPANVGTDPVPRADEESLP